MDHQPLMPVKSDVLHNCAHCSGSGTCKAGDNGESCAACVKRNELKEGPKYIGLACGTCGGLGKTDTLTYRLAHRTQPLLAWVIVTLTFLLIILFGFVGTQFFHEVLAFCTTLLGGVTGYYFVSRRDVERLP